MNSLRKRAELESLLDEVLQSPEIIKGTGKKRKNEIIDLKKAKHVKTESIKRELNIYNLPVEIYYCIFENLDPFTILQFRQLNHHFKNIIDKCGFIWKKKIKLNHNLENQIKLENFIQFSTSFIPFVDSLKIECSKKIKLSNENTYSLDLRNLKLNLINFNMNNIFLFEFFKNCKELNIESLNLNSQTNHFNLKNQLKSLENQLEAKLDKSIKKFYKHLEKFELNCIAYDSRLFTHFHAFNQTNFIKLFLNNKFKNLTNLTLLKYNNSLNDLLACLRKNFKKLAYLKFEECNSCLEIIDNDDTVNSIQNKLKIEKLIINDCSNDLFQSVLLNLIDLNFVEHLSLFTSKENSVTDENFIKNLVRDLDLKLNNLKEFHTNFDFRIFLRLNFKFNEKSLVKVFNLDEEDKFSVDDISSFLNNYLIPNKFSLFENLKLFKFGIKLKCLLNEEEETEIKNLVFKFAKNFKSLKKLEINLKCLDHNCSSFKECKLYRFKKNMFNFSDYYSSENKRLKVIFLIFK
jgi:hypothetical protein